VQTDDPLNTPNTRKTHKTETRRRVWGWSSLGDDAVELATQEAARLQPEASQAERTMCWGEAGWSECALSGRQRTNVPLGLPAPSAGLKGRAGLRVDRIPRASLRSALGWLLGALQAPPHGLPKSAQCRAVACQAGRGRANGPNLGRRAYREMDKPITSDGLCDGRFHVSWFANSPFKKSPGEGTGPTKLRNCL